MKLVICCNHAYPHKGGSEEVIRQVAEGLTKDFGYSCEILSITTKKPFAHNGVKYSQCSSFFSTFIRQMQDISPDHILIYSDLFVHWFDILTNPGKIKIPITLATVGLNEVLSDEYYRNMFKKFSHRFKYITHSYNYVDYQFLKENNIPVSVIPNGIDMEEFSSNNLDIREKYSIPKDRLMFLTVSNFFNGKGYDILPDIYEYVGDRVRFTPLVVCSSIDFRMSAYLEEKAKLDLKKFGVIFLKDIEREEVVGAFKCSDLFVFPSIKEVAPLVILESMAAGLPYVSFGVGNIPSLGKNCGRFIDDTISMQEEGWEDFADSIVDISSNNDLRNDMKINAIGKSKEYDWKKIIPMYNELFVK